MGLRDTTLTNLPVSENSMNDLLKIASTINSHLIEGTQQITPPPPPLDEVNDEDTVSTCHSLQFSTSIS